MTEAPGSRSRGGKPHAASSDAASSTASGMRALTLSRRLPPRSDNSSGCTPISVIASGASPRSCASARTSLKPVWWGLIFTRLPRRDFAVAQHAQRARRQSEIDRVEHEHATRRRDRAEEIESLRPAVEHASRASGSAYFACNASTARTPKPSSAHSTLPIPSTSASQPSPSHLVLRRRVTTTQYARKRALHCATSRLGSVSVRKRRRGGLPQACAATARRL